MQQPYNPYAKPLSPPMPYSPPQKSFWDTIKGRAEELNDYAPCDGTQWSEGEQPAPDLTHELPEWERQTWEETQRKANQHLGGIGHSNAIGGDIQDRLGVGRGFVFCLMLLAAICFFGAIALTIASTLIHF